MTARLRGEQQPGFHEILGHWLPYQPWFPPQRGRHLLTRVGGLRLPPPPGDADPRLFLELHIFEVELAESTELISVPLTLRSRPSSLAGKRAFIGKLTSADHGELWVYDGAWDQAFLAAWIEMARREQGSRNGRSRGEALSGFDSWEEFTVDARRSAGQSPLPAVTRTVVAPTTTVEDGDWEKKIAVDFLRRPAVEDGFLLETALTLTKAHSSAVPRVLGTVSGAWQDPDSAQEESPRWVTGMLGVIREAAAEAPDGRTVAHSALTSGMRFTQQARSLGAALGNFHADLAGAFGAHPQTAGQLQSMSSKAQQALTQQWAEVREEFDEDEAADLSEVIDVMTFQLRDADEPLMLQPIHGDLSLATTHRVTEERWVITEAGGIVEHSPGLRDVVTLLMSLAHLVMEVASETPEATDPQAESAAPVNFGQWYEELSSELLKGYRDSDADSSGIDSVFFRAAMLAEALELFSRWEGRWVFRPSMLLQAEG